MSLSTGRISSKLAISRAPGLMSPIFSPVGRRSLRQALLAVVLPAMVIAVWQMAGTDGSLFGEGVKNRLKEHLMEECNLHTIVRLPNSVFKPYAAIGTNLLFFDRSGPTKDIWYYEQPLPEGRKQYTKTQPMQFSEFADCITWFVAKRRKATDHAWRVPDELWWRRLRCLCEQIERERQRTGLFDLSGREWG